MSAAPPGAAPAVSAVFRLTSKVALTEKDGETHDVGASVLGLGSLDRNKAAALSQTTRRLVKLRKRIVTAAIDVSTDYSYSPRLYYAIISIGFLQV